MFLKHKTSAGSLLEELRQQLKIDQDALDEVVIQQPVLFDKVAEQYTLLISQRDEAKAEVEELYAELDGEIRAKAKEKLTNPEIDAKISRNTTYRREEKRYQRLVSEAARWATLRESFMQRSFMIRELCGLYSSGYWGQSSIKGGASGDIAVEKMRMGLKRSMRKGA